MLRKTRLQSILFFLVLTFFISSGEAGSLKYPLENGTKIAVISNFRQAAVFQRVGTTSADNVSFYRSIPGLNVNRLVIKTLLNELNKSRKFKVYPIYSTPSTELIPMPVMKRGAVTPAYWAYLRGLVAKKGVDTVILVTPEEVDFADGQYYGSIWFANGYGLFNRALVFTQTNIVFSAFHLYVIDIKSSRVSGDAAGEVQVRPTGISIAWHKGYAGVSKNTLLLVSKTLKESMPQPLIASLHRAGVP